MKNIGTIKTASSKAVGKFYRSSASKQHQQATYFPKNTLKESRKNSDHSLLKRRSNSVGKIYTTSQPRGRDFSVKQQGSNANYNKLINYEEMENKLSSYLACTIRTNSRQKYNYLSQNNMQPSGGESQPYSKWQYYTSDIKQRRSLLQLAENPNCLNIESKIQKAPYKNQVYPTCHKKLQRQSGFSSKKEGTVIDKENIYGFSKLNSQDTKAKKDYCQPKIFSMNHQEHKAQLSNKLKKIIDNYQTKNKELSLQMQKLQKKFEPLKQKERENLDIPKNSEQINKRNVLSEKKAQNNETQAKQLQAEQCQSTGFENDLISQLIADNLKNICLKEQCDEKLHELWKQLHKQIVLDQKVRLIKAFINQSNIKKVLNSINSKKIKKIQENSLKTHAQEYDPFLIEKVNEMLKGKQSKQHIKWISDTFLKFYEESEHHWLKYLSQQKMQCSIKSIILERELVGLRHSQGSKKDLNLRDFTRWLSILFKANLRNRNVFQIFHKLKDMSYVGRFIELLEAKNGIGPEQRKCSSST